MARKKSIPTVMRNKIILRDKGICQNCGKIGRIIEMEVRKRPDQELRLSVYEVRENGETSRTPFDVDHIYPEHLGGKATEENLQLLCQRCNRSKGFKVVDQ